VPAQTRWIASQPRSAASRRLGREPTGGRRHGRAVHDRPDEHLGGVSTHGESGGAVGRRDHDRPAGHAIGSIFKRRVAEVEAGDHDAAPLAAEHGPGAIGSRGQGFFDRAAGRDRGSPVGQGRHDCGRGPQDVDHHGDPSRHGPARHTMIEFVTVPVHVVDPAESPATGMHHENHRP